MEFDSIIHLSTPTPAPAGSLASIEAKRRDGGRLFR